MQAPIASQSIFEADHLGEEVVNEGAEGESVRPAVREVGDVHVLKKMKKNIK